jgi:hypothetical protein
MDIAKLKDKAQSMRVFTLGEGGDDELRLQLRPVKLADILERTNAIDPGAFAEFASVAGEEFNLFREFSEDVKGAKEALTTSTLIRDGYLVLGVEGPIKVVFDTEMVDVNANQLSVSNLVAIYGDEVADLEARIKRISGVRSVASDSKSKKK